MRGSAVYHHHTNHDFPKPFDSNVWSLTIMPRKAICPKTFWKKEAKATFALFLENPNRITLSVVVCDCCRYLFAVTQEKNPTLSQGLDIDSFLKVISYVINNFE
jgi:hypothetical protein